MPGGNWQQVISSPVSAARAASSAFHARVRWPLELPASAVISSRLASGVIALAVRLPPAADRLYGERGVS